MSKFEDFYRSHVGKAWDKYGNEVKISLPQVVEPFGGQCVSLVKTYLYWLYGKKVKASYGNAIDFWTGRKTNGILELCDVVDKPRNGDIIITDADPTYGHIFIYKDDRAFTQNCCANPRATLYPLSYNGRILGVLRPKGIEVKKENSAITNAGKQALYRVYNPNSGDHVYTLSLHEAQYLRDRGWSYEGVAWTAPESGADVWRLYCKGQHHYTASVHERDALIAMGWINEGPAFKSSGSRPIYRLYNPNSGAHLLTARAKEHDALTAAGWKCEGQEIKW